ncbi:hypothetical protein B0H13DRAFT_2230537 [Mycena leptocephala]|nr:hypothetical protein B0H13DRAFT_2230537 [Mycena leptocephala]
MSLLSSKIASIVLFKIYRTFLTADEEGSSWSVTNVPATGLTDITFPLTIVEADHISGYYLPSNTASWPRPDSGGKAVLHGVFSSFVAGSTTSDANCHAGADGGPGVSCAFEWNGVYGRTYDLGVKTPWNRVWIGTAIDTVTGARIHIGSYTLPPGAGRIQSSQGGFVEWYSWNGGEPPNHCARLPYQKTVFGSPRTTHTGSIGTQSLSYEYGDCVGQVGSTRRKKDGFESKMGFRIGEVI